MRYEDLAPRLEAARDERPSGDKAGRMLAVTEAYRAWALAHPVEFQLVYGAPIPAYTPPPRGAATAEAQRACAVLVDLVVDAPMRPSTRGARWADFEPAFVASARESHPEVTAPALALALSLWGRMHGLVALEVYGHLPPLLAQRAKHFGAEMRELAETL